MPRKLRRFRRRLRRKYGGARSLVVRPLRGGQFTLPTINRQIALGIHYFKRTVNSINEANNCSVDGTVNYRDTTNYCFFIQNPAGAGAGNKLYGTLDYQFSLEALPGLGEFQALFDAYRINKVVIKIIPRATCVDSSSPGATSYQEGPSPIIHSVIDHDDINTPGANQAGIDALRQYSSYKARRMAGNKPLKYVIRPQPVGTLYGYNNALIVNPKKMGAWINMANVNIKHYGFKSVIEYLTPNNATTWRFNYEVECTYYFVCKGVR